MVRGSPCSTPARRAWRPPSWRPRSGWAASGGLCWATGTPTTAALRAYADVLCHPDAVAQAEGSGGRDYWRMDELSLDVRLLHGFTHRFIWDGGPVHIDGTVEEGDQVAGFEVIDLPGHAPGLIGLWRERDRVALVSDCIYMNDMHGRPQPPAVPLDAYNLDTGQARRSIAKLAAMNPAIVVPGHLGPLTGPDVVTQLEAAAAPLST